MLPSLLLLPLLGVLTQAQLLLPDHAALQQLEREAAAAAVSISVHATPAPSAAHHHHHHLQARQETQASSGSSTISIPGTAAAGGLTYLTPAATAAASYYKIAPSNAITFGWNYTSLYVTPTSLTFEARCSANGNTYTLGSVAGGETSIVWDPYEAQQSPNYPPLAQASYTLRVYDERGADATAEAGRFNGANSIVMFAMYSPADYTPLAAGWSCPGCSSAATTLSTWLHHPALVAVPVTLALVLIGGAGVLGR
ncbi:hypothetical protein JCM11251_000592 [Rhodosporidiobolus azoricus]